MPAARKIDLEDRRVGAVIHEARKKAGLTQQQLADLLGTHRSFISFMERGARRCPLALTFKIAKILGIPANELMPAEPADPDELEAARLFSLIPRRFRRAALRSLASIAEAAGEQVGDGQPGPVGPRGRGPE